MSAAYLLCDPALLMPPPADDQGAVRFWRAMIEWTADQRVRLGPAGHQLVLSLLADGWPERDKSDYPPGLGPEAHRSLARMLTRVLTSEAMAEPPALSPRYRAGGEGENAIATDAASLHRQPGLVGIASSPDHWEEPCEAVGFEPPPPQSLPLLFNPSGGVAGETDLCVRRFLKKRRLTLVGGIRSDAVLTELKERFRPAEIRWLDAEPGTRLNLDPLRGLGADRDLVYCLTGHIGHEASIKAKKCCRSRGLEMRKVATAGEVAGDLCRRHGVGPLPGG